MTEGQVKWFCKWAIDNSGRPFTDVEKEILKEAVDSSQNLEQLLLTAIAALKVG